MKSNKKVINGVWFYGLSGSGKTTVSKYLKKNNFKKSLIIDGDMVRKYISTDLNYTLSDRLIQLNRIYGLCKLCHMSNIFSISSTVYMNNITLKKLKNLDILVIKIDRDFNLIKKFKIYQNTNVVGVDIKSKILDTDVIYNNGNINFFKLVRDYFINYTY
jgi:hypothetical protein|tara:strand:+ start:231 stop:710 length:480 start_codon:yes stop_codon:yes gene_type:complete